MVACGYGPFSVVAHLCIVAAIVVTVATFETAKRKPSVFNGYNGREMVENTNEKF